ncbi:MAG: hypothetical protein EP338_07035 [Bacteroidetes bacterium]|nr:MAG: hypothetical protein EP338_07035 [Bacteroidota bacterium]
MINFKSICLFFGVLFGFGALHAQIFEGNQTPEYEELVRYYQGLEDKGQLELYQMGDSDYGLPIYLCVLNGAGDSLKTFERARKGTTLFINNGIHPGEPDGINACGMLTESHLKGELQIQSEITLAFVLCYNVGGAMNRGSHSRANQLGPMEYGFRGNAQNLDLNRDFIKMDSKNAFTFARIFHALDPDLFIDTHVSNGADYQHTMTLIYQLEARMEPSLRQLTSNEFVPEMDRLMREQKIYVTPYVQSLKAVPDSGLVAFDDLPRYAMGYASMFHSLSITTETHMLKGFEQRVHATRAYLGSALAWLNKNASKLEEAREEALKSSKRANLFYCNFQRTEKRDSVLFMGFEHGYKKSQVTGLDRLYYDRDKPFTKYLSYYKDFRASDSIRIPSYYVVSAQCVKLIERLQANEVQMRKVGRDTTILLSQIEITDYESRSGPYEGHYLHSKTKYQERPVKWKLKSGDYLIPTNQNRRRFICSVLEPLAPDSYFAWNFFDSYLQQKEYFSPYVFEDIAAELIQKNPTLKKELERRKAEDPKFAESQWAQLYFIYQRSHYFEASYMKLPIYKIY